MSRNYSRLLSSLESLFENSENGRCIFVIVNHDLISLRVCIPPCAVFFFQSIGFFPIFVIGQFLSSALLKFETDAKLLWNDENFIFITIK